MFHSNTRGAVRKQPITSFSLLHVAELCRCAFKCRSLPDVNPTSPPHFGPTVTWFSERPTRRITPRNADRTDKTPTRDDSSDSYQRDESGVSPYALLLLAVVPMACLLYCYHSGKLPARSSPRPAQVTESPRVDSPPSLDANWPGVTIIPEAYYEPSAAGRTHTQLPGFLPEIGSVRLLRTTRYNNEIPPSYESIVRGDDSLPSYDDAVAMPRLGARAHVQLSAYYVNGDVSHQTPPREQVTPVDTSTVHGQSVTTSTVHGQSVTTSTVHGQSVTTCNESDTPPSAEDVSATTDDEAR